MRIGGERLLERLVQARAHGRAARVVVLDDRRGRQLELVDQLPARVEVEQVVERQLLAVQLRHHRQQVRARAGLRVVAPRAGAGSRRRRGRAPSRTSACTAPGSPPRARRTSARSRRRSARCRRTPRAPAPRACAATSRPSDARAARRARRRSSPGETTTAANAWFFAAARISVGPPMSMFSITSCVLDPALPGHALERVEVHAHEVDRLDLVLVERVARAPRSSAPPAARRRSSG